MRKIFNILFISALLLFGVVSCKDGQLPGGGAGERFATQSSVEGVYVDSRQVLVYNSELHQTAVRGLSYRIQTDDQGVLFSVLFDKIPEKGGTCTMSVQAGGIVDFPKPDSFVMTLQKTEGGRLWFWNDARKIGVIVPTF